MDSCSIVRKVFVQLVKEVFFTDQLPGSCRKRHHKRMWLTRYGRTTVFISSLLLVPELALARGPNPNILLTDNYDGSVTVTNNGKVALVDIEVSCEVSRFSLAKNESTTKCTALATGDQVTVSAISSADSNKTADFSLAISDGSDTGGGGDGGGGTVTDGCIGASDMRIAAGAVTAYFDIGKFWTASDRTWDSISDVRVDISLPGLGGRTQLEVNVAGDSHIRVGRKRLSTLWKLF